MLRIGVGEVLITAGVVVLIGGANLDSVAGIFGVFTLGLASVFAGAVLVGGDE